MSGFQKAAKLPRAKLIGTVCPACSEVMRAKGLEVGQYSWAHRSSKGRCYGYFGMTYAQPLGRRPAEDVQNRTPVAAARAVDRRSPRSRTRARSRHAGGRPRSFIAALVVARAAQLYDRHRGWTGVVEELEREGNGTYARNTLRRRVEEYSRVRNSASSSAPAAAGELLERPSKTRRRRLASRR